MTEPLSPAARAVWEAFRQFDEAGMHVDYDVKIAAALRAAADQVVPEEQRSPRRGMRPGGTGALTPEEGAEDQRAATRRRLRAIAAELEGAQ